MDPIDDLIVKPYLKLLQFLKFLIIADSNLIIIESCIAKFFDKIGLLGQVDYHVFVGDKVSIEVEFFKDRVKGRVY